MKRLFPILLLVLLIIAPALAKEYPIYNTTMIIENGQCVPINSTIDIGSIGWEVPYIAYYGRWENSFAPESNPIKLVKLPEVRSSKSKLENTLVHYYIDPEIFGNYTGYWYQYYGEDATDEENAGNLRMFYANDTCPEVRDQKVYEIRENEAPEAGNFTAGNDIDWLPDKHVADILVARGETSMSIPENDQLTWWVFGTKDKIYDQEMGLNGLIINTNGLQPGGYDVIIISPGKNGITEEEYIEKFKPGQFQEEQEAIVSPFRESTPLLIKGLDPLTIEAKLKTMVTKSRDDTIYQLDMEIQEPEIQIKRIDATHDENNATWYNVRGYTNLANGTTLTIQLDKNTITPTNKKWRQFQTMAEGTDPGSWREFNAEIPINYDELGAGQHHDVTVSAPGGGASTTTGIYIYREQKDSYVPPEYIEYLGTDPFITPVVVTITIVLPTPTPEIITKMITIPVTPSNEQVRTQQEDIAKDWAIKIGILVIGLCVFYCLIQYGISVARRLKP